MSSRKQVLITGASSGLMRTLAGLLDPSEYEVHGLSRDPARLEGAGCAHRLAGDIRDAAVVAKHVQGKDMIIHAAAVTHSRRAKEYDEVNRAATERLAALARKAGVRRFVYVSSRAAGHGCGAYGRSKMQGEEAVRKGMESWLIFRPAEIYGAGRKQAIEKILDSVCTSPVVWCPGGSAPLLYPIHEGDAAQIMHRHLSDASAGNRTVTVNGERGYAYRDIVRLAARTAGRRVRTVAVPKPLLFVLAGLMKALPFPAGIVPDQVQRLYCGKAHEKPEISTMALEDYIMQYISSRYLSSR